MRLIIFGAAGRTGRLLTETALARGHTVTAFVRTPSAIAGRRGLDVCAGDVRDPSSVQSALGGHDALLSCVGHSDRTKVDRIYSTAARNYVHAMEAAGVTRIVALSAWIGESLNRTGLVFRILVEPLLLRKVWEDLEVAEGVYRASRLEWTAIRAARLTDKGARGRFRTGHDLRGNFASSISRADVAAFMLSTVENGEYLRESPMIAD